MNGKTRKCDICHEKPVTVSYKRNINGHVTQYALCAECARKQKEADEKKMASSLSSALANMMADDFFGSNTELQELPYEERICPVCHSTFDALVENDKAGCGMCYTVFENEFRKTLRKIHGSSVHAGKKPESRLKLTEEKTKPAKTTKKAKPEETEAGSDAPQKTEKELLIEKLQKELDNAVKNEDYEKAITLRDRINNIKKEG